MPKEENISRLMQLIRGLKPTPQAYLNQYLRNAPRWVLESMKIVQKEKDAVFIEENTPADYIYILVSGTVRAVDYRIQGIAYDYMWFRPVKVFGAMELLFNIPQFMTTLVTATPCTFLLLSRANYESWIWEDKNAMKMEIETTGNYILEQNRTGRVFLFLQGMERIVYIFIQNYEKNKSDDVLLLETSRRELAERSGLSVKTVNRAIASMEEQGMIERHGRKIKISRAQYQKMRKHLEGIVESTDAPR